MTSCRDVRQASVKRAANDRQRLPEDVCSGRAATNQPPPAGRPRRGVGDRVADEPRGDDVCGAPRTQPDYDLIAVARRTASGSGAGEDIDAQTRTRSAHGETLVSVASAPTGGNQSWNSGSTKRFDPATARRPVRPSRATDGAGSSPHRPWRGRTLAIAEWRKYWSSKCAGGLIRRSSSSIRHEDGGQDAGSRIETPPGGVSGVGDGGCKPCLAFGGSNPPPPFVSELWLPSHRYDRQLGRAGSGDHQREAPDDAATQAVHRGGLQDRRQARFTRRRPRGRSRARADRCSSRSWRSPR